MNALRHGLYSKYFHPEETKRLELMKDLSEETAVLRVVLGRLMGMLSEETESFRVSALAGAMADCAARIGGLMRVMMFINQAGEGTKTFEGWQVSVVDRYYEVQRIYDSSGDENNNGNNNE